MGWLRVVCAKQGRRLCWFSFLFFLAPLRCHSLVASSFSFSLPLPFPLQTHIESPSCSPLNVLILLSCSFLLLATNNDKMPPLWPSSFSSTSSLPTSSPKVPAPPKKNLLLASSPQTSFSGIKNSTTTPAVMNLKDPSLFQCVAGSKNGCKCLPRVYQ